MSAIPTTTASNTKAWDEILKDVYEHKETRSSILLVLGKRGTGKSSLIQAFQKIGIGTKSHNEFDLYGGSNRPKALDYAYITICTNENLDASEGTPKCDVWILEDPHYKFLLESVLLETDLCRCAVLLCIDLSKPWSLSLELSEWLSFLVDLITPLLSKLPFESQEALRQKVLENLKNVNPNNNKQETEDGENYHTTINLGIPIVVCVTNSTQYKALNIEKFPGRHDVVLAHLRRHCLPYGAALCYVSTQDNTLARNVDVLYSYLIHRTLDFPFTDTTKLDPPDAIFIPSGWDSADKLEKFIESTVAKSFDVPLESLLPPFPDAKAADISDKVETISIDEFLGKLLKKQPNLAETIDTAQRTNENLADKHLEKSEEYCSVAADTTTLQDAFPTTYALHSTRTNTGSNSSRIHGSHSKSIKSNTARGNTESLRNFFQMLLTKHPTGSSTARYTNPSKTHL